MQLHVHYLNIVVALLPPENTN